MLALDTWYRFNPSSALKKIFVYLYFKDVDEFVLWRQTNGYYVSVERIEDHTIGFLVSLPSQLAFLIVR